MESRGYGDAAALEPLRRELETCFADVEPGDRITGVSEGPHEARFYFNGEATCVVERRGFRRGFFGIWLERGDASAQLMGGADGERI